MNMAENPVAFPCPGCGGQMQFDAHSQNLKCQYCGKEQPIANIAAEPEEYEFDHAEEDEDSQADWGTEQVAVKCENCGSQLLLPANQTAAVCAFCGSPEVLPQGAPSGIRPESVIPFRISPEEAKKAFARWKSKRWFIPNALKKQHIISGLTGIYIPYWTYDAQASSVYTAEVGVYHYRMEPRTRVVNGKTETYMERVRYTVWHWTNGAYERSFNDVLIPASAYYDANLLDRLGDFALDRLMPYKPEYLSGFAAERYSVSRRQGWEFARSRMDEQLYTEIRGEIHGDEIRHLDIRTRYNHRTYKHLLLPVWNAVYTYKNKPYRYMVNGQTGTVSGSVPRSPVKIALFALFCASAALLAIYFLTRVNGI